ncbi:hypothetical protein WG947_15070 [Pontibacter sp. H259]|uniref:hypothetical protein n=1 Tax=Pontibacter sp. H259 TaxID=3133421 RepID=UPI0030C4B95D
MRNFSIALVGAALFILAACEQPVPRNPDAIDYDVAGYVQQQIDRLQARQPAVLKSVKTENEPSETIQLEKLDWAEELAVFEQADINKPTLREYYIRTEQPLPDGGREVIYQKKEDAKAPVERLYLQLSVENRLKKMEATLLDENLLFYSKRKAILDTNLQTGNIEAYTIDGVQKLIFGDSLHFTVQANL